MPSDPELLQHALGLVYRYLSRRERTTDEVRRQLDRKGVVMAVADEAIEIVRAEGYLDDVRFARLFVQDKRELEQWGSERIRQGLLARGLDQETIEAALVDGQPRGERDQPRGECDRPRGEVERALTLLRRRFPSPPQDRRERDRALGMLIRKGYEPELALDALGAYARAADWT